MMRSQPWARTGSFIKDNQATISANEISVWARTNPRIEMRDLEYGGEPGLQAHITPSTERTFSRNRCLTGTSPYLDFMARDADGRRRRSVPSAPRLVGWSLRGVSAWKRAPRAGSRMAPMDPG